MDHIEPLEGGAACPDAGRVRSTVGSCALWPPPLPLAGVNICSTGTGVMHARVKQQKMLHQLRDSTTKAYNEKWQRSDLSVVNGARMLFNVESISHKRECACTQHGSLVSGRRTLSCTSLYTVHSVDG
jgi:hypothetical protein